MGRSPDEPSIRPRGAAPVYGPRGSKEGSAIMVSKNTTLCVRASINEFELEYEVRGEGEPVLLIHGSIIGDAFAPLLSQTTLSRRYRLINYHRRGFDGSSHDTTPI